MPDFGGPDKEKKNMDGVRFQALKIFGLPMLMVLVKCTHHRSKTPFDFFDWLMIAVLLVPTVPAFVVAMIGPRWAASWLSEWGFTILFSLLGILLSIETISVAFNEAHGWNWLGVLFMAFGAVCLFGVSAWSYKIRVER